MKTKKKIKCNERGCRKKFRTQRGLYYHKITNHKPPYPKCPKLLMEEGLQ